MSKLNYLPSDSVPNGTKIVALYGDGSGARLFLIDDEGHILDDEFEDKSIDCAPDNWLMDAGFLYWLKLPDSFQLWFEQKEEKRP